MRFGRPTGSRSYQEPIGSYRHSSHTSILIRPIQPRPLLPLIDPPHPLLLPQLPSPLRSPKFNEQYVLTTHIIPAAYPRSSPYLPPPQGPSSEASKAERQDLASRNCATLLEMEDWYVDGAYGTGNRVVMWICVNRFVRKDLGDRHRGAVRGLTLFCSHGNGFPKETWEPTLQNLLTSPSASLIDEVWCWESVQHGDAGLLNSDHLGCIYDWADNARDILNFLLNYLPSLVTPTDLPTHLVRLPASESQRRGVRGFDSRTLVAVGHSFGGCTTALAAINFPALFSSLILVDPIIILPRSSHRSKDIPNYVLGALRRRDTWASRTEALQSFAKIPFFSAWDPAVLRTYVEHGLTEDTDGRVKLKLSGMQEAVTFAGRRTAYEVWELIERLDEKIELRWIVPGKVGDPGINIGGPRQTQERVWRRPANSTNVSIPTAGHLIVQEAPQELAHDIDTFVRRKYWPKANL